MNCFSKIVYGCLILYSMDACNQPPQSKLPEKNSQTEQRSITKPSTIFSDTLIINSKAAIFYYPDSLQLVKLRSVSDTAKFDAIMHEYEYQFRYAHTVLKKNWSNIKIIEAINTKYLLFIKSDKSTKTIDLDNKNDPYGLIVFDPAGDPSELELTNAESEISFYFLPNGPQKIK